MRSAFSILCLLLAFGTFSQTNAKKIIGKWRWVETSGGFAGTISTPVSEGKTIKIEFTAKGIHNEWEETKLVYSRPYRVEKAAVASGENVEWIVHGSKKDMRQQKMNEYFEFRGKDTLILSPKCPDCFVRVFVRTK
jgi:hypothetical protein